jgi:hypothetical protein
MRVQKKSMGEHGQQQGPIESRMSQCTTNVHIGNQISAALTVNDGGDRSPPVLATIVHRLDRLFPQLQFPLDHNLGELCVD